MRLTLPLVCLVPWLAGCPLLPGPLEPDPPPSVVVPVDGGNWNDTQAWMPPDAVTVQRNPNQFPTMLAELAIGNDTGQTLTVRVRALKPTVQADCKTVAKVPSQALARALFQPARTWVIPSGRSIDPLANQTLPQGTCRALLVDGSGIEMRLLFWSQGDYAATTLPTTVAGTQPARLLRLQAAEDGAEFVKHPAVFAAPPAVEPGPAPGCTVAPEAASLAWSEPVPLGDRTVITRLDAPDGCTLLEVLGKTGVETWYLCLPPGVLPFEEGDSVFVAALQGGHSLGAVIGYELLGDTAKLRFGRGTDVVYFGKGEAQIGGVAGCGGAHDACGQLQMPLQVTVQRDGKSSILQAGQEMALGPGASLHLVRAEALPVLDQACQPQGTLPGQRIESVFVQTAKP